MKAPPLDSQSRRDFLKLSAGFGAAATLGGARLMAQNSPAGGPGEVKDYFTLNGKHFPIADGTKHLPQFNRLPVDQIGRAHV